MDILETIIANKRKEVMRQKSAMSIDYIMKYGDKYLNRTSKSMRNILASSSSGIIAEFKRRSPSKGWLHPCAKIADIVPQYENNGASACSILTDSEFFGGSFDDFLQARDLVKLPLLRKDFIIDEYQLYQSRMFGADAVLLIASSLTEKQCKHLAYIAHQLEMEVLLEIHTESELLYMSENIDMLGVNNRNLGTFHTDVENSFKMIEKIKREVGEGSGAPIFISESGISGSDTIRNLRKVGFKGFLIGEIFMKTEETGKTLSNFIKELTVEI